MKYVFPGWIVALLLLIVPANVFAHGRSTSYITGTLHESSATIRVKMALIDQNALLAKWSMENPPLEPRAVLPTRVWIGGDAGRCQFVPTSFHELTAEHGSVAYEWQTRCPAGSDGHASVSLFHSDLLFDVVSAHVALVRFHDLHADMETDYVFTDSRREVVLPSRTAAKNESSSATIWRFLRAGVEHLLTGWDHLAFLLALVVASRSLRMALICLTGFTLGHSLTLSLAVLGHAAAKTTTVEVLIAVSILLVSTENVWLQENRSNLRLPAACLLGLLVILGMSVWRGNVSPVAILGLALFEASYLGLLARANDPEKLRWICAGLFGLLHGFGFAGMLNQMDMPPGNRLFPLGSFNLGIELAQVFVACLAWPLLVWLKRRYSETRVVTWGSALTIALGAYGYVARLWG